MRNTLQVGSCVLAIGASITAHSATLSITNISIVGGNLQLLISSDTGITNQIQCKTSLSQANWVALTNLLVAQSPYAFVDVSAVAFPSRFYRVASLANSTSLSPSGMVLIAAGPFTMGNSIGDSDITDANPTTVALSAFYMDTNLVSYAQWQSVYNWAINHGYGFFQSTLNGPYAAGGKAANHPVQTVDWYDAVKWCNARSQQAGKTPVYYSDAAFTQVYTSGEPGAVYPNWTAIGYRLPTEAEWEKAARGGLIGQRFPWGNLINENLANYDSDFPNPSESYDLGPNGYNPIGSIGYPPTSPVGSFAPNGYGLYDMAGNVWEWCWDWYGTSYVGGLDPRGPASGGSRVFRGGGCEGPAYKCRTARRHMYKPSDFDDNGGFRTVLPSD